MAGKSDIIERIAFETGMPKAHAARAIEVMVDAIGEWLQQGDRVVVPGLGSFYVSERPPRQVRNPRTGETVSMAASRTARFRPGKELKAMLNPRERR